MEGVSPTLNLLLISKRYLSSQRSLRSGVLFFVNNESGSFSEEVGRWLALYEQGKRGVFRKDCELNVYRKQLLEVLEKGLEGYPILSVLEGLEEEIVGRSLDEVDEFAAKLPLKMLMPLLFFQFPAFMMLILGPILKQFLEV